MPDAPPAAQADACPRGPQPSASSPVASEGTSIPRLSSLDPRPTFPRHPGETPRAFGAFLAWFQLGQGRSLAAVAEVLGEKPDTVKSWSSRYRWSERLQVFQSGLLQAQLEAQAALQREHAADWARRTREFREHEWAAGQKLLAAVLCFLDSFGDREVEKMTLAQVSRALQISSRISWQALRGDPAPEEPAPASLQDELAAALKKAYGQPALPVAPPQPTVPDTACTGPRSTVNAADSKLNVGR